MVSDMLSRFKFCVLLELFFLASVICPPNCLEADPCIEELSGTDINYQFLLFAQPEEQLGQTCFHLQAYLQCFNRFTSRCLNSGELGVYRQVTDGMQSLITDLCTEGSTFREEYLVHAKCYNSLKADYKRCDYDSEMEIKSVETNYYFAEDKLIDLCGVFHDYRDCVRIPTADECGTDAASFLDRVIIRAAGSVMETNCPSSGSFTLSFPISVILMTVSSAVFSRHYL